MKPRHQGECCPGCGGSAEMVARDIAERIAKRYGYDLWELQSPSRARDRVTVRRMISCVLRRDGFSLPVIATALNRDHTTILFGLQRVDAAIDAGVGDALPKMPFHVGAES